MSALEQAARELEAASLALHEALRRGDAAGLEQALARRERACAALAEPGASAVPASVRERVAQVARKDATLLDEARAVRDALRRELDEVRSVRRAARTLRPDEAPRFVSRRV